MIRLYEWPRTVLEVQFARTPAWPAHTYVEPFLRRKSRRIDWKAVGLIALGFLFGGMAFFVLLMDWGHAHAATVYQGVVKDGQYLTPEEFCQTV